VFTLDELASYLQVDSVAPATGDLLQELTEDLITTWSAWPT
jgi:hypothetical protein